MSKPLEGIDRVHIEVDDILIEGRNEQEAIKTFREVLQRCRDYGIMLARFKLQVGQEVTFAGADIKKGDYSPTMDKIQAIQNLPAPTNVKELRSFLGPCSTQTIRRKGSV